MKSFPIKSFSILAIIICIFACDRLSAPGGTDRNCAEGIGPKRTLAEAELFASDILQQFDTKASPHRKIHERICVKRPVTKGENQDDTDTLMYLFNLADDGFIIVSADNRDYPLVAYVEKGQIDQSLKTSVPPFDDYLSEVLEAYSSREPVRAPRPLFRYETFILDTGVEPLLNVRWGQRDVYGAFCPNGVSGCVATAMAQIMTKYSKPDYFTASVSMGGFNEGNSVSLTWNKIKQHRNNHNSTTDSCYAYHSEISALLREIGDRVNMEYHHTDTSDHSSAYSSDVPSAFNSFGYYCSELMNYQWPRTIQSLNNGYPVYVSASRIESIDYSASPDTTFAGHAFLIDGYIHCGEYYQTYIWNGTTYEFLEQTELSGRHVYHINWGWNGTCNGYFPFEVFNTDLADEYDDSTLTNTNYHRDYLFNRKIIVDIHP